MSTDDLPREFFTPSRDEISTQYQRDYKFHQPNAVIGAGTAAEVRGNALADTLLPLYADAKAIASDSKLSDMSEAGLNKEAIAIGLDTRLPPSSASGFVIVSASTGGGTIQASDEIKDPKSGVRAKVVRTALYNDGVYCAISTIDTGPTANLPEGTRMTWTTQRPGIASTAIVAGQNGDGLEGGRDQETLDEMRARLADGKAKPASAGNDAEIRKVVRQTPEVPVQEVFTFAATDGPGTTAYAFTLRPATAGGSRAPTSTQVGLTLANLVGELPSDDGPIACLVVEVPTTFVMSVRWTAAASGWVDLAPYPSAVDTLVSTVTSAYAFRIYCTAEPSVGATMALYDASAAKFRKKRILSYTSGGANLWNIVCDSTNGASDPYLPVVAQYVSPWSDSLDAIVAPTIAMFDALGPGEMYASFFDEGMRQKRQPLSPGKWPSVLSGKSLLGIESLPEVDQVEVESTFPLSTDVGTANVSVNLRTLGDLAIYAL